MWCKVTIFLLSLQAKTNKKMNYIYLLIVLALTVQPLAAHHPTQTPHKHRADSLDKLVSGINPNNVSITDTLDIEQQSRLFMPLTFYRGIAKRKFSLDSDTISTSEALLDDVFLNIYLNRPDLVLTKESTIDSVAPPVDSKPIVVTTPVSKPQADVVMREEPPTMPEPKIIILKPNFWTFKGDYSLQFQQNYVSDNWYKGGERNYSFIAGVVFEANYNNKQKVKWDNKLEMKLGVFTSPSDTVHKVKTNTDYIRFTSSFGLQATKKWYYTVQSIVTTQMFRGYQSNKTTVYSDFMSPISLNLSVGMDYKPSWFKNKLTGSIHLAPLSYNLKYVDRKYLNTRYGIESDRQALNDYGSLITADLNWIFSQSVSWRTRFKYYTTYERSEMEWENTFSLKFNKYVISTISLYPRFDDSRKRDNDYGYFQFKEYIAFGFSYSM